MVMTKRTQLPTAFGRAAVATFVAAAGTARLALGATLDISSPASTSSYHAGDAVPVQWIYEGTGENFAIHLLKGDEQVADLCSAEENGVCFDLTQDQTVILPDTGLESGSDYTVRVQDQSSDLEDTSETFTIIGTSTSNVEITSPDGYTTLNAGGEVSVSWLYVGENTEFDIYLRQDGERVSSNLCADQEGGSCTATIPVASATITLPDEIENAADYRLLVVDKVNDDAWGLSVELPVGVAAASVDTESDSSAATKLALVIGLSAGGVCLLAVLLAGLRTRNKNRRREEKLATLDMLNKRRPAPSVSLAVEGMAEPDSPDQRAFINPIYSTSQTFHAEQYEGQITPPTGDSAMWRRSRDLGRYVGRTISKSFSHSQSNMND
ncbi:unnamed protein product [Ectocarpus sp. 12 AP-2014]